MQLKSKKMKKILRKIVLCFFILFLAAGCTQPYITEEHMYPDETKPIKLVQLSDIHFKNGKQIFSNMIEKENSLNPYILVFTGDMIDDSAELDNFFDCISGISIECPKYAVLGNWEYWSGIDIELFESRLRSAGITLLINEADSILINDRLLSVSGLDDFLGGKPDFSGCAFSNEGTNIILAHCPVLFDSVCAVKPEGSKFIMLSGHTHAGQITFFGLPIVIPEGSGEYVSGFYYKGDDTLYVSKGIGNSTIDIRMGADPNIDVIYF